MNLIVENVAKIYRLSQCHVYNDADCNSYKVRFGRWFLISTKEIFVQNIFNKKHLET